MKAVVNQRKCTGAGECVKLLPEVFRFEAGSKKARASDDGVPTEHLAALAQALEACPANAISLVRSEDSPGDTHRGSSRTPRERA
jgi:ferredoxin